jgi:putative membrane protein
MAGRAPEGDNEEPVSVEVEPDVRFTLASERTFLAWTRTALAVIASGIAVERLLSEEGEPRVIPLVLGIALVLFGAFIAIAGYRRWQESDRAIRSGAPLPQSAMPMVLTWAVAFGAIVAVIVLIALTI